MRFKDNLHVIMFVIFLLAFLKLQFATPDVGWPFPTGYRFILMNSIPAIFILSLAMLPFGYAEKQTTSLKAFFLLTTCAAIVTASTALLPVRYWAAYSALDRFLAIFLVTMVLYGICSYLWRVIEANVTIPRQRTVNDK